MFRIPAAFRDDYENYLVMDIMRRFLLEQGITPKYIMSRSDLINQIEEFANKSNDNLEIVLDWLDGVLKEGIKHIYIRKVNTDDKHWKQLGKIENVLEKLLLNPLCKHICGNNIYDENIRLVKYEKRKLKKELF